MTPEPLREAAVRAAFRRQARDCAALGSPFTAAVVACLADRLDAGTPAGRRALAWPGDPVSDALALRFAGALHARALSGLEPALASVYPPAPLDRAALEAAILAVMSQAGEALAAALDTPPQTNETARAAALPPAIATALKAVGFAPGPAPLRLLEIGASAGLNLRFDHFRIDGYEAPFGPAESPVRLTPEQRGADPPAPPPLDIRLRAGCDQNPLDPTLERNQARLRAFLWPDQTSRMDRLEGALRLAQAVPALVEAADAAAWIAARLAYFPFAGCASPPGEPVMTVVYHTVFWQYPPRETRARIAAAIEAAGARATEAAPLAWISLEPAGCFAGELDPEQRARGRGGKSVSAASGGSEPASAGAGVSDRGAALDLKVWPGDGRRRRLARMDFHGWWMDWRG